MFWIGLDHSSGNPIRDWLRIGYYRVQTKMMALYIGRLTLTLAWWAAESRSGDAREGKSKRKGVAMSDLPIYCKTYQEAEDLAGADETIMVWLDGDPRIDACWAIVSYPDTGLPDDQNWEEDDRRSDGSAPY